MCACAHVCVCVHVWVCVKMNMIRFCIVADKIYNIKHMLVTHSKSSETDLMKAMLFRSSLDRNAQTARDG